MNPFNLKGFFFEDLNFQAIDKKATGEMDKIWDKEQLELWYDERMANEFKKT